MIDKDFIELIRKSEEELLNDSEKARKIDTEMETIKMEHSDFFDNIKNKTISQMTPDELKEMFDIIKSYVAKLKMAN